PDVEPDLHPGAGIVAEGGGNLPGLATDFHIIHEPRDVFRGPLVRIRVILATQVTRYRGRSRVEHNRVTVEHIRLQATDIVHLLEVEFVPIRSGNLRAVFPQEEGADDSRAWRKPNPCFEATVYVRLAGVELCTGNGMRGLGCDQGGESTANGTN